MIAEVLIHHLDTMRFLCGPLRVVGARAAHTLSDVRGETLAAIFLETANGAPVTVTGTMAAPGYPPRPPDRLEIVGRAASATLGDNELQLLGPTSAERALRPRPRLPGELRRCRSRTSSTASRAARPSRRTRRTTWRRSAWWSTRTGPRASTARRRWLPSNGALPADGSSCQCQAAESPGPRIPAHRSGEMGQDARGVLRPERPRGDALREGHRRARLGPGSGRASAGSTGRGDARSAPPRSRSRRRRRRAGALQPGRLGRPRAPPCSTWRAKRTMKDRPRTGPRRRLWHAGLPRRGLARAIGRRPFRPNTCA